MVYKKISSYFNELDRSCYLVFFGMLYTTIFFCSFIMGYKTVSMNGFILCSSVFVFPLLFPLNDSITEILGSKVSYFMIIAIIICEFLFSIVTYALASMPSPKNWGNQEIYPILTSGFLNIAVADSVSLAIGFVANTYVLENWGVKLFGQGFFIRSLGATAVGELLFTISTNFITFHYHDVANMVETINIISSDYLFKMAYSLLICIPNAFVVTKIKNIIGDKSNAFSEHDNITSIKRIKTTYRT